MSSYEFSTNNSVESWGREWDLPWSTHIANRNTCVYQGLPFQLVEQASSFQILGPRGQSTDLSFHIDVVLSLPDSLGNSLAFFSLCL